MNPADSRQTGESAKWYLRIDPTSVFGPVVVGKLREWAQQGRIAPGNEVSPDGASWMPAEQLPELEMVWNVALGDGTTFGPLNIKALRDLIEDQTVTLDSSLTNVDTGDVFTIGQMRDAIYAEERTEQVAAAIAEQHRENVETFRRVQSKLSEASERLNSARTSLNEEREKHSATRNELATTAEALAQSKAELHGLRQQLEDERRQLQTGRAANEDALRALRGEVEGKAQELARLGGELNELRGRLDEANARQQEVEERLAAANRSSEEQALALRERVDQVVRQASATHAELEAERRAHEATRAEQEALGARIEDERVARQGEAVRVQELEQALASTREELELTRGEEVGAREALAAERTGVATLQAQLKQTEAERDGSLARLSEAEQALAHKHTESDTALEESLLREQDLARKLVRAQQEAAEAARTLTEVQQQLNEATAAATSVKTLERQLDQERKRNDEMSRTKARLESELLAIKDNFESEIERNRGRLEQLVTALDSPTGREIVIPELVADEVEVMPEPPKQTSSVLADLEAQAQRELRAWQNARRGSRRR